MIGHIAPLLLAAAGLSAAASAQPPQDSRGGTPEAAPVQTESVVTLTDTDRDGGPLVLRAKDGTTYRVDRGDGGVVVLRAKDGHAYRVRDSKHVFVLRARDGDTYRVASPARAFTIHDGRGVELSSLEACDAARPLLDRSTADAHDRTRIILCDHGAAAAGDHSAQLERVLERVQNMEGLSDSSRERVVTALHEAIEQLRSGK
jgi:hypothetical protein